jgi:hypothetical protein
MSKKYRIYSEEEPSDLIRLMVAELPGIRESSHTDCQACGRTHLSENWRDGLDERTLSCMEDSMQDNPDKYVLHKEESVFSSEFYGKDIVLECPCHFLRSIEDRLILQRTFVEDFYKRLDLANHRKLLRVAAMRARFRVVK